MELIWVQITPKHRHTITADSTKLNLGLIENAISVQLVAQIFTLDPVLSRQRHKLHAGIIAFKEGGQLAKDISLKNRSKQDRTMTERLQTPYPVLPRP